MTKPRVTSLKLPKIAKKVMPSAGKVMATVLSWRISWDDDVLLIPLIILTCSLKKLSLYLVKKEKSFNKKNVVLLHDNARRHTAKMDRVLFTSCLPKLQRRLLAERKTQKFHSLKEYLLISTAKNISYHKNFTSEQYYFPS